MKFIHTNMGVRAFFIIIIIVGALLKYLNFAKQYTKILFMVKQITLVMLSQVSGKLVLCIY